MTTAQAVSWLLNARRRMLNIARHASPGGGRAVALTWLDEFEAAVRDARARGQTEHDIPLTSELGPAAQAAVDRAYLADLVPRESGGSLPAAAAADVPEVAAKQWPRNPEAPLLNKSGGSDVEGK